MKNCVTINLKKDEIIININEKAEQTEIIKCLKKKVVELKKLYQEEKTPIFVIGKVLKNKEMKQIKEIIETEIDVEIEFDSPKELGLHGIKRVYNKEIGITETMFHRGSLRSGQRIEFEGSIVVMGDVNAGAEIVAAENIAVIGHLRGLAHAGAKGNKNAIISANKIEVTQIRIANIIKEIEESKEEDIYMGKKTYVYVDKDKIMME